jgi:nucleoside-triphosphatase
MNNFLITGTPGVGKTTLIKSLFDELAQFNPIGFYTGEIRERGVRRGFELDDFHGHKSILSHIQTKSACRVGKYGVDIEGFERYLDAIEFNKGNCRLVIIDEIGKMECLSGKFLTLIKELLDSEKTLIATMALMGGGIIYDVKQRQDARIFQVTAANRDSLATEIVRYVKDTLT